MKPHSSSFSELRRIEFAKRGKGERRVCFYFRFTRKSLSRNEDERIFSHSLFCLERRERKISIEEEGKTCPSTAF